MSSNHKIKGSGHLFIKLTKFFQTRMFFNSARLAQTVKFLVASIRAILFESKLQECLPLGRIIKNIYLLSYYLTDKSYYTSFIPSKMTNYKLLVIMSPNDISHLKMEDPY